MINVCIFGNGNISFEDFQKHYIEPLKKIMEKENDISFSVCDFRGTDTLMMEYLKNKTPNVSIFHIGERPRYLPDKYKTQVSQWNIIGGFKNDDERDNAAIKNCTHFLAIDFNANKKRKSGTLTNIEKCMNLGKNTFI